jgi:hypothetical protein
MWRADKKLTLFLQLASKHYAEMTLLKYAWEVNVTAMFDRQISNIEKKTILHQNSDNSFHNIH